MLTFVVGDLFDEEGLASLSRLVAVHTRRNGMHYTIYIIRDGGKTLYVGKGERGVIPRLLNHLGLGDFKWAQEPSMIGQLIKDNLPVSSNWQIEIRTVEECRSTVSANVPGYLHGEHITVNVAESVLISTLEPSINRTGNSPYTSGGNIPSVPISELPQSDVIGNALLSGQLAGYMKPFIESLGRLRHNTRAAYGYAIKVFTTLNIPLKSDLYECFHKTLVEQKYAKGTRKLYLLAVREFVDWLASRNLLPVEINTAEAEARLLLCAGTGECHIPRAVQIDRRLPEIISFYDNQELPENQNKRLELLRSRAIMHTLYSSAGRVSEVTSLTRAQVADGQADQATTIGKGNKPRTMFFTREAQAAIRAYCNARQDTYPALFISHGRNKGRPLTRARVWQTVKLAVRTLGISTITSPHSFRHYRATQLLNEGMSLEFVQEYLGHSSPATTRIVYAQVNKRVLKEQLNEFGLSPKEALKQALERANKE